jgi:hypothetical protein
MAKNKLKIPKRDIKDAESKILKRIEKIVFDTRRQSAKKKGGYKIEDGTGALRRRIKSNTNFIKEVNGGFSIDVKMVQHYFFLDEGTQKMEGWFLSEAIFEDKEIRDIIRDLSFKAVLNFVSDSVDDINDNLE